MKYQASAKTLYYVAVDVDKAFVDTYLFGQFLRRKLQDKLRTHTVVLLTVHSRTTRMCVLNGFEYRQVALSAIAGLANECIGFSQGPSDVVAHCAFHGVKTRQVMYQTASMPVALIA